eukprot:2078927-Alexandrium_andersonii.AAC.1
MLRATGDHRRDFRTRPLEPVVLTEAPLVPHLHAVLGVEGDLVLGLSFNSHIARAPDSNRLSTQGGPQLSFA